MCAVTAVAMAAVAVPPVEAAVLAGARTEERVAVQTRHGSS